MHIRFDLALDEFEVIDLWRLWKVGTDERGREGVTLSDHCLQFDCSLTREAWIHKIPLYGPSVSNRFLFRSIFVKLTIDRTPLAGQNDRYRFDKTEST